MIIKMNTVNQGLLLGQVVKVTIGANGSQLALTTANEQTGQKPARPSWHFVELGPAFTPQLRRLQPHQLVLLTAHLAANKGQVKVIADSLTAL